MQIKPAGGDANTVGHICIICGYDGLYNKPKADRIDNDYENYAGKGAKQGPYVPFRTKIHSPNHQVGNNITIDNCLHVTETGNIDRLRLIPLMEILEGYDFPSEYGYLGGNRGYVRAFYFVKRP